jgi:hypothetical protein
MAPILGIWASGATPSKQNSYESIATVDVGLLGSSMITFSSIPSTYQHLQVRLIARGSNANTYDSYLVRTNSDTGSNYTFHSLDGTGTAASVGAIAPYSGYRGCELTGATATSGMFGVGVVDILDYANTNKYKTARMLGGNDRNGSGSLSLTSGVWMNTAAVTRIDIIPVFGSTFVQYSSFALYGIK